MVGRLAASIKRWETTYGEAIEVVKLAGLKLVFLFTNYASYMAVIYSVKAQLFGTME